MQRCYQKEFDIPVATPDAEPPDDQGHGLDRIRCYLVCKFI